MKKIIEIEVELKKEGLLKTILNNSKQNEELLRVLSVLRVLNGNACKDAAISSKESKLFNISQTSLLSAVLSEYKDYLFNSRK